MDDVIIVLNVSPQGDNGTWTVSGAVNVAGMILRLEKSEPCSYAEMPSVLCELVHDVTGSCIPRSDGVSG